MIEFLEDADEALEWVLSNCSGGFNVPGGKLYFRRRGGKLYCDVIGSLIIHTSDDIYSSVRFGKVEASDKIYGKFGSGDFKISTSNILSLCGCPEEIDGDMDLFFSKIYTLEYAPNVIHGNVKLYDNKNLITSPSDSLTEDEMRERLIKLQKLLYGKSYPMELFFKKSSGLITEQMVRLAYELGLDLGFSDDVKNIASTAMKGNHKLR